jgi:hypothetical protein
LSFPSIPHLEVLQLFLLVPHLKTFILFSLVPPSFKRHFYCFRRSLVLWHSYCFL